MTRTNELAATLVVKQTKKILMYKIAVKTSLVADILDINSLKYK